MKRNLPLNLLVATLAVALAIAVRAGLDPWLGRTELPFATMFAAIAIASAYGGYLAGLFAMVAGWLVASRMFLSGEDPTLAFAGFTVYVASSLVLIAIAEAMHVARRRAEASRLESLETARRLGTEVLERERGEQALRHEQELLQKIFDTIPAMIVLFEPDTGMLRLNREFSRCVGWTTREAAEIALFEACFPDPEYRGRVREFLTSRRSDWIDLRMRTSSGDDIETSWATIQLSDRTRVGIGIDITERKQAEQALRTSELRFRTVADAAPVMIWLAGTDKLCTWFNRPWLDFTGRMLEQELGDGWAENVHPDDFAHCMHLYNTSFDARAPFTMEYRLRRADGAYRWVLVTGLPLTGPGGEFTGYIGSCVDITDRKLTEERLTTADRLKDEFLATLAHELRNPLAPIQNAVEVMRLSGGSDAALERSRGIVERQVRQLSHLVDDLLDVSRITRGLIHLRRERVTLERVVHDALEASRPLIEMAEHDLVVTLPREPVTLEADPTRLAQVFANLLNNAARYTEPRGRIWLDSKIGIGELEVSVRDTGVGIAPENLSRVFEMFSRGPGHEVSQGGLGIGLSLAQRLVELHGGRIEAKSAGPGEGSEFIVRLPLPADATVESERAPAPGTSENDENAAARVLIVEDNKDSADTLAMLLGMLGHEVHVAGDGARGLEMAQALRPDVVLLDIGLPRLNGYEVAHRIRLKSWGSKMTLVALTGWGQEEDKRRAKSAGFDRHLTKPVDPSVLRSLFTSLRAPAGTP